MLKEAHNYYEIQFERWNTNVGVFWTVGVLGIALCKVCV